MIKKTLLVVVLVILAYFGFSHAVNRNRLVIESVPVVLLPENSQEVEALIKQIRETPSKDIIIKWRGFGGAVILSLDVIRTFEDAQKDGKVITLDIISEADSAHAYISCFADKVVLRDGSSLMFHAPYSMDSNHNKVHEYEPSSEAQFNLMLKHCVSKGFLTYKEIIDLTVFYKAVYITNVNGQIVHTTVDDI